MLDRVAEVLRDRDERTARDRRQDAVGFRRDELAVLRDEQEVRTARLLNVRARSSIEVHVLVEALLVCEDVRIEAHRVVQAGLDVARAVRCSAVIIADADRDRLDAVLEVRADRRAEQAELVLIRRLDADDRARSEEIRTQVEGTARLERRNPILVGCNDLIDSLEEHLLGDRRHLEALCRVDHALCVHVRTERDDTAILRLIGLEAFEDFLAVLQDAGALIDRDVGVIRQMTLAPFAILEVCDVTLGDWLVSEAQVIPIHIYFCH